MHAFLYSGSSMTDLGTLGGTSSFARAINDSSQTVGWATNLAGDRRAFLYENGTMSDLGTLGGSRSEARYINASGQVVGFATNSINRRRAFLYENGGMVDLGTLGGMESEGRAINDQGDIVGWANDSNGIRQGFLYQNGNMIDLCGLVDCIAMGWDTLELPYDINENGDIVGRGIMDGKFRAFLITASPVPVPAAVWLFASGLLGLAAVARRRRTA